MSRCVVIGCGWAGMHHIKTVHKSSAATLVAVVDPAKEKREELAATYNVSAYSDLATLLAQGPAFDVGIVATLPDLHYELCNVLIAAGKHILCEKPVCRTSAEIAQLQQKADGAGVQFGVVFNQRYGAAVQKAKMLLTQEETLHLATASMYQHWPTKTGGHVKDTFMITDACCHLLDLLTYLCGPVQSIKAVAFKNESELYSDIAASILFKNGCVGSMTHSNVGGKLDTQHPFQCVELHTKRARYRMGNHCGPLTVYPHEQDAQLVYETSVFQRRDYVVSMHLACEDFLQALAQGRPLPADINDALTNMMVLEEAIASLKQ